MPPTTGQPARTVALPSGERIPALGQGTWGWAEHPDRRADEVAALHTGLELGMTLVDTAEMYADGGAEALLGQALAGHRDEVFVVSKVLPSHASRTGTIAACDRSLARLRTDLDALSRLGEVTGGRPSPPTRCSTT